MRDANDIYPESYRAILRYIQDHDYQVDTVTRTLVEAILKRPVIGITLTAEEETILLAIDRKKYASFDVPEIETLCQLLRYNLIRVTRNLVPDLSFSGWNTCLRIRAEMQSIADVGGGSDSAENHKT